MVSAATRILVRFNTASALGGDHVPPRKLAELRGRTRAIRLSFGRSDAEVPLSACVIAASVSTTPASGKRSLAAVLATRVGLETVRV
jgi:hypothetical protein